MRLTLAGRYDSLRAAGRRNADRGELHIEGGRQQPQISDAPRDPCLYHLVGLRVENQSPDATLVQPDRVEPLPNGDAVRRKCR
jgi:hypothetical protein